MIYRFCEINSRYLEKVFRGKEKKTTVGSLQYFLTLFARGRGYGCAVYPSHGAKQQYRSSTPSSKQAWHEKLSKDICL